MVSPVQAQVADTLGRTTTDHPTVLGFPLHDIVIGGGLVIYQGELDRNPHRTLSGYLLNGGMDITLGVERRFNESFLQANFRYMYVKGGDQYVEGHSYCCGFSNSILGGNVLSGFRIAARGQPDAFRLFLGLGVIRHLPINKNPDLLTEEFDVETVNDASGLWSLSLPVGVSVLRTVRLTTRIVMTDYLDGAASGQPFDLLFHINVTRPFSLGP